MCNYLFSFSFLYPWFYLLRLHTRGQWYINIINYECTWYCTQLKFKTFGLVREFIYLDARIKYRKLYFVVSPANTHLSPFGYLQYWESCYFTGQAFLLLVLVIGKLCLQSKKNLLACSFQQLIPWHRRKCYCLFLIMAHQIFARIILLNCCNHHLLVIEYSKLILYCVSGILFTLFYLILAINWGRVHSFFYYYMEAETKII